MRVPDPTGGSRRVQGVRTYSTMTPSLQTMADRLLDLGVTQVVMEATSSYWKPPLYRSSPLQTLRCWLGIG